MGEESQAQASAAAQVQDAVPGVSQAFGDVVVFLEAELVVVEVIIDGRDIRVIALDGRMPRLGSGIGRSRVTIPDNGTRYSV